MYYLLTVFLPPSESQQWQTHIPSVRWWTWSLRCGECVCSRCVCVCCVQYVCVCVCVCLRAYSVWVGVHVCELCSTIRGSCSNFQVFNVYSRHTMWLSAAESSMVVLRFLPQIRLKRGGGHRTRGLYVCWGCPGSTDMKSAIKKK